MKVEEGMLFSYYNYDIVTPSVSFLFHVDKTSAFFTYFIKSPF